jgi:hypothetical protein
MWVSNGKDSHPQSQYDINARTKAWPPGRNARVLNDSAMYEIKETVGNDPKSYEGRKKERADYRCRRKGNGNDQFPNQGVIGTA